MSVHFEGINLDKVNDDKRNFLQANELGMNTIVSQMKTDGSLFGENLSLTDKTAATREVEKLEEKQEEIQANIKAYVEKEQAKLEREIEQAKAKARAAYDKDRHGNDEEAFVQSEVARNQNLQRTIEVPEKMQSELNTNKELTRMARNKENTQMENKVLLGNMMEACLEKAPEIKNIDISA